MAKVAITEQYLTDIADAIREKTGQSSNTYLPSEMANAIMTISGGGGITPTGTISITENGIHNVTNYASANVNVPSGSPTLQTKTKTYTPTTSQQTESVIADSGYDGLDTVSITVNAMPSGTAGTPTVTKGTVSNHSVSVTPSVTNTTGYITGSTKTGTAVTVSASELVSGSETKTSNGTYDVTNLAELVVNVSGGGTPAISVVDTTDSHGGTIREITALDISDTTAVASDVAQGKYFYTAQGVKTAGTASGGSPSATQHTIYFEFTDSTDTTINAWYDSSFISDAITATTPITYGQKTVDSASLDGVEWYTRPTETWETIYNDNMGFYEDSDPTAYPYCWVEALADVSIPSGSSWRVTFDGTEYLLTGYPMPSDEGHGAIGNTLYLPSGTDDGSGVPFALYHTAWGAWSGSADVVAETIHTVKIERLVTT